MSVFATKLRLTGTDTLLLGLARSSTCGCRVDASIHFVINMYCIACSVWKKRRNYCSPVSLSEQSLTWHFHQGHDFVRYCHWCHKRTSGIRDRANLLILSTNFQYFMSSTCSMATRKTLFLHFLWCSRGYGTILITHPACRLYLLL